MFSIPERSLPPLPRPLEWAPGLAWPCSPALAPLLKAFTEPQCHPFCPLVASLSEFLQGWPPRHQEWLPDLEGGMQKNMLQFTFYAAVSWFITSEYLKEDTEAGNLHPSAWAPGSYQSCLPLSLWKPCTIHLASSWSIFCLLDSWPLCLLFVPFYCSIPWVPSGTNYGQVVNSK